MPRRKKVIPSVDTSAPGQRIARPELITRCKEAGKGWRRNEYGDWWPCTEQDEVEQREEPGRAAD